jgi:hypothetical protein
MSKSQGLLFFTPRGDMARVRIGPLIIFMRTEATRSLLKQIDVS